MKLDSGKSGRAELPLTTYISGQTEARKNLPIKPPGEKRGQEIWVGTKAQAPKSFLRDFYMVITTRDDHLKRRLVSKASETSHDKRFTFHDPLLHEMFSVKVT